jgi:hypothetical protein
MSVPTKYHSFVIQACEYMARCGLTDDQMSEQLNIARDTLVQWRKKYPELDEATRRGKDEVDSQIEEALRQRALGYMADEYSQELDSEGNVVRSFRSKKHVPSNPACTIFWLKNRRPRRWRERQEIDMQGRVEFTVLKPELSGAIVGEVEAIEEPEEHADD